MKPRELSLALKLLFENFWIVRNHSPEDYAFLRRHQDALKKELRDRFGMNMIIRQQYIQLLKRPHRLESWMGDVGLTTKLDFSLFCCAMAYAENLEADSPFMLDELIQDIDLNRPNEIYIDWTNYNHRKSLIRVIKKMLDLRVIETIQGDTSIFEHSEENQEVLFSTTVLARAFLSRVALSYTQYKNFNDYWHDIQENRNLEGTQTLYQRLMMESHIQRTAENEETFSRLRNYYYAMNRFIEDQTLFQFELYRDYAAFTLEQRDQWEDIFPSRKVIDEILIQLATLIRNKDIEENTYGLLAFTCDEWQQLLDELKMTYQDYWSKEFKDMTLDQLWTSLLDRGKSWSLFDIKESMIAVNPVFGRLIAEMRTEDEQ